MAFSSFSTMRPNSASAISEKASSSSSRRSGKFVVPDALSHCTKIKIGKLCASQSPTNLAMWSRLPSSSTWLQSTTPAWKKFPKGSKNLTKERTKFIVEQVTSAKGPFSKMTDEICTNLKPVFDAWAFKATGRVEQMHRDLRDVLFKSFEGKKMPDARREQIAPAIKAAMEKARAVLQADLDGYSAEIL